MTQTHFMQTGHCGKPHYRFRKAAFFTPPEIPIVVARDVHRKRIHRHLHEFMELVIITGGTARHVVGQAGWPVAAGNVFVIGRGQLHSYQAPKSLTLINILYEPERLSLPFRDLRTLPGFHALFALEPVWHDHTFPAAGLRLAAKELVQVEELARVLEDELRTRRPGYKFMAVAFFMQIVGFLARCYDQSAVPGGSALLRLGQAISYMESHYDQRISMSKLAGRAGLSKRHFERMFQEALHIAPLHYLIRLRIRRAAGILRQGVSIKEVMHQVEFRNSSYFSRQFRHLMGVSPQEFRRRAIHYGDI